jgi:hypothetical protein
MRARTFLASSLLAATVFAGCHYGVHDDDDDYGSSYNNSYREGYRDGRAEDAPAATMAGITGATASRSQRPVAPAPGQSFSRLLASPGLFAL